MQRWNWHIFIICSLQNVYSNVSIGPWHLTFFWSDFFANVIKAGDSCRKIVLYIQFLGITGAHNGCRLRTVTLRCWLYKYVKHLLKYRWILKCECYGVNVLVMESWYKYRYWQTSLFTISELICLFTAHSKSTQHILNWR